MATDGCGKAPRLRWLYVARCVVAFMVTVIAVVVLVKAVVVMLRPGKLLLKVAGGYVSVDRIPSMPPRKVYFNFTLTAYNPIGRARDFVVFGDVYIRLVDSNASTRATAKITEFHFPLNISLSQQLAQDMLVTVGLTPAEDIPMSYVQALFDGRSISAEMQLDGHLTDRVEGGSEHSRLVTYFCWPMTIAVRASSLLSLLSTSEDTTCLEKSEAPVS